MEASAPSACMLSRALYFCMEKPPHPVYPYAQHWEGMTEILLAVAHGWVYFTSGSLSPDKAGRVQNLAEKMSARFGGLYLWTISKNRADRLKKMHKSRPRLIAITDKQGGVHWFLLCDHPELPGEILQDARDKRHRLHFWTYELVRITKPAEIGGGMNWTWRYIPEVYKDYSQLGLRYAAHESPNQAQAFIGFLSAAPGYSGLRTQRAQLFAAMRRKREKEKPGRVALMIPELPVYRLCQRRPDSAP